MPICHTESTETFHLSCWAVNESLQELQQMCFVKKINTDFIKASIVESRKKEMLVVRLLLHEMGYFTDALYYNEDGKPFLKNSKHQISISHTNGLVCIMLSALDAVGVDVELISDRVEKIKHKFLKDSELAQRSGLDKDNQLLWLLLAWCAKEALYKYTARIYFDFKAHFTLNNIDLKSGEIMATCRTNSNDEATVFLNWKRLENEYILVHTIPTPNV